jgi:hypothetical protein
MSKIKIYPIDTNINGSDKWIGSDVDNSNRTKNFTVSGLSDYFNATRSINLVNSLSFKYDTLDIGDSRSSGTFSFVSEIGPSVSFSSISTLVFSKNTSNGKYVVDFMNFFVGNIVVITKADEPNLFGIFKVLSYSQRLYEPDFYDVEFEFLYGNGSISEDDFYFVSLLHLEGESVDDKSYTHIQGVASSTWSIIHSLNKFPSVTVVNINNVVMYGDVKYINENELQIDFSAGFSGKAYIN